MPDGLRRIRDALTDFRDLVLDALGYAWEVLLEWIGVESPLPPPIQGPQSPPDSGVPSLPRRWPPTLAAAAQAEPPAPGPPPEDAVDTGTHEG